MKTLISLTLLLALSIFGIETKAQDEQAIVTATEEAQNLDLIAVMNLFKESNNLEEFEKLLNDPVKGINNLDLNHDRQADYIRVLETIDGNYRVIVLQSVIGQNDFQDVAVINVERTSQKTVKVVCQGNTVLYGDDYYVEPETEVYVHIYNWPIWTALFAPHYSYYHSPYYWNYYPNYYNHYYVVSYYDYYGRIRHHHNGYYHNHNHAYYHPNHNIYKPHKSEHLTYNANPNRPANNGTNPRSGNGGNGTNSRPGVDNNNRSQTNTGPATRENSQNGSRTYTRPTSTNSQSRGTETHPTREYSTSPTTNTRQEPARTRTQETRTNTRSTEPARQQSATRPAPTQQQSQPARTAPAQRPTATPAPAKKHETKTTNTNQQNRQGGNSGQRR